MSARARPTSGGGVAASAAGSGSRRSDRPGPIGRGAPGRASGSSARPAVDSHHDVVVWVGPAAAAPIGSPGSPTCGSGAGWAAGSEGAGPRWPGPVGRDRAARRARAWYSGPCLRGSAYSFGLSVQYVPLVVPYQLAPPQSGSNGPSTPSYEVDPSVALLGGRSGRRRDPAPLPSWCPSPAPRRGRAPPARAAPPAGPVRLDHDVRPVSGPCAPFGRARAVRRARARPAEPDARRLAVPTIDRRARGRSGPGSRRWRAPAAAVRPPGRLAPSRDRRPMAGAARSATGGRCARRPVPSTSCS